MDKKQHNTSNTRQNFLVAFFIVKTILKRRHSTFASKKLWRTNQTQNLQPS